MLPICERVHDQQVRDLPLPEGQLVYLSDFSTRGPQRTQNRWRFVRYRVLRMPQEGGSVYSIVPVDEETKVRQAHRTMLKAAVGVKSPGHASPHDSSSSKEEPSFEYDLISNFLWSLLPYPPKDQPRPKHLHPALGLSSCPPSPTSTDSSSMGLCRTTRQTAGQHSNVHCFPWPAGDVPVANPSASVAHSVSALFRPWS